MTEVSPGIYWLKLPIILEDDPGLSHVNVYLARGRDGFLLIDSGWNTPDAFETLSHCMREIGADIKDISQIVCTHVHPDHYGMAGRIRKLTGASLFMHHIEKGFIAPRYINMHELLHQTDQMLIANGVSHDEMVRLRDATVGLEQFVVPAMPDTTLHDGETISTGIFTFRVVWTPGHSSGHICLYEPDKKILLSGDHILPSITPNIWGTRARWQDLPGFHQRMAIFETLSHLEMMAAERLLDRMPRNGVNYYRRI
jgi:glyoxylase-like metal-dependent hydrolase (beta-lactamase superfamily II)